MQNNRSETTAVALLILTQGCVNTVQAVRLRRRSRILMDDQANARIVTRARHSRRYRGGIVVVATDVESEILLLPRCQSMPDGMADDLVFLPRRDQYGRPPLQRCDALFVRNPLRAGPACQFEAKPTEIHGQVVNGAEKKPESGKKQQLLLNELQEVNTTLNRTAQFHETPVSPAATHLHPMAKCCLVLRHQQI